MYDRTQLLKGVLEGCILSVLINEGNYGYGILSLLNEIGFQDIKEGSIYPVLTRLEKKGYISAQLIPSTQGPSRKYYSTTPEGKLYHQEFMESWNDLSAVLMRLTEKERMQNENKRD